MGLNARHGSAVNLTRSGFRKGTVLCMTVNVGALWQNSWSRKFMKGTGIDASSFFTGKSGGAAFFYLVVWGERRQRYGKREIRRVA